MVEHFLLAPSKQALRYRVLVVKSIHYMPDLQDIVVGFEPTYDLASLTFALLFLSTAIHDTHLLEKSKVRYYN